MKYLICVALVILAQQPSELPKSNGITKAASAQISQQSDSATKNDQAPTDNVQAGITQSSVANQKADQADENIRIQGKLVLFTGLLVVVGFLQAVILAVSICAISRQTQAINNNERAWVLVDSLGMNVPKNLGDGVMLSMSPNVQNHGRTPARISKMSWRLHALPKNTTLPIIPEYKEAESCDLIQPPKLSFRPFNIELVKSDFAPTEAEAGFLYIYGFINYRIGTKTQKQTRFCFRFHSFPDFDPTPSGFYMVTDAPDAYTHCT